MAANEHAVNTTRASARNGVRIKTIALPAEHGGWGFLLEPIALGLLLAPSVAGSYLGLGAVAFFLARHPLTLVILNRKRQSPRTALAKRFAVIYLVIGSTSFVAALAFAPHSFLLPLMIAAPLAIVQIAYDWSGRRRVILPELAGVIAISSLASAIALCGGWPQSFAHAVWVVIVARAAPAIFYVRVMLARLHGKSPSAVPMIAAHCVATIAVAVLTSYGLLPRLAVFAMLLLTLRAVILFLRLKQVPPRQLGFSEVAFGAVTVVAVVIGKASGF